jgi:hypothetical protein
MLCGARVAQRTTPERIIRLKDNRTQSLFSQPPGDAARIVTWTPGGWDNGDRRRISPPHEIRARRAGLADVEFHVP